MRWLHRSLRAIYRACGIGIWKGLESATNKGLDIEEIPIHRGRRGVCSIARYWVGSTVSDRLGIKFPYGTFVVRYSVPASSSGLGSRIWEGADLNAAWQFIIPVGFVGAYSTFATYEWGDMIKSSVWRFSDRDPLCCQQFSFRSSRSMGRFGSCGGIGVRTHRHSSSIGQSCRCCASLAVPFAGS